MSGHAVSLFGLFRAGHLRRTCRTRRSARSNRDSLNYDDELRKSGHYIASNALQSVDSAVTVRVRNKRISSSDGPFAETKEHLGGFILIEAATLDEAVRIASGIPMARYGSIEVRPTHQIEDTR